MKLVNKICQVLAVVLALASLVLFFMNFAVFTVDGAAESFSGAILGFGAEKELSDGTVVNMAKSTDYLCCFLLTLIGAVLSVCTFFKWKKTKYFAPAFGLGAGIYMLVITLYSPWKFIDTRSVPTMANITDIEHTVFVLLTTVALFAFAAFGIAHLLINDRIEVAENGGKTIPARVALFVRDYKSELNKIVWPTFKDVVKNTVIVLIMCLLVGALIWLLDFGLGTLLELILGA